MPHMWVLITGRERTPVVQGPKQKPLCWRLLELAEELQERITEAEYKKLCDLAQESYKEDKD